MGMMISKTRTGRRAGQAPVLDPGRGKYKTGCLWALARDDRHWGGADPPSVVCICAPGSVGEHAQRFLHGFRNILQVDGYAGYKRLARPQEAARLAFCWSYVAVVIMLRRSGIVAPDMRLLIFSAT